MKLASMKSDGRDGTLVVVSADLTRAVAAPEIAPTMTSLLDDWELRAPALQDTYARLNVGEYEEYAFPLDLTDLAAPLPRAFQFADGSAYLNHVELVRKARGAEMPERLRTDPLIYQGCSDPFLGPNDNIVVSDDAFGIDFEAELVVILDDTPMGVSPGHAGEHIRLLALLNDVSLRHLVPDELAKGFGFFHSKPPSAFAPIAVTPDELGNAWDGRRLHLPVISTVNDDEFGRPNAGVDMDFDFPTLIAHCAKTRRLGAGTIIGSGTVSNRDRSTGSSCIAERRMIETLETGTTKTPFLTFGDKVRIEVLDEAGMTVFGAIEQYVLRG